MKYPKINKKPIDDISKRKFDLLYKETIEQIFFDNEENELNLTKSDIELLAWNIATRNLNI